MTEIANMYGCARSTISRRMYKWNIPRKEQETTDEFTDEEIREILLEDLKKLKPLKYKFKDRKSIFVPIPIKAFEKNKTGEARVTLVISDLHLGDTDHLPLTYWSTIHNVKLVLKVLTSTFNIPHINIILNGDIVCGRGVFRLQEVRTITSRGHWQTALAEMVIKDTIDQISKTLEVNDVFIIKGTHEKLAENYAMYIKRAMDNVKYGGHHMIYNIGEDLGNFNILFTHGYGSNAYYPISYDLIRDVWKIIGQYRLKGIPIERVCIGHYHWLSTDMNFESFILDSTGAFQRWEKTISQRPSGVLMYLFFDNEVGVIPIKPDPDVYTDELEDSALEYKNMRYYAEKLLKHLEEIEKVKVD